MSENTITLSNPATHGLTRSYRTGCRCTRCRAANAASEAKRRERKRQGDLVGTVDGLHVRKHLDRLRRYGMGLHVVAEAAGVHVSTVDRIRRGLHRNVQARTAAAILAVSRSDIVLDQQLVPAKRSWIQIRWLLSEGFTHGELAKRLGYTKLRLQFGKDRVTARTAMKIEKLYNTLAAGN